MAKLCSHRVSIIFGLSLCYYLWACFAMSRKNMSTDESALIAFKSSITSDPSRMLSNWSTFSSSNHSLCNWVGVTCDLQHGRVKALNLSNMGLAGTIPPHVGNLSFLVDLDLKGNRFHGELPQELFHLHRLRLLKLSHNELGGSIPLSMSNLSKLEYLDCSSNFIKGAIPSVIGQLRHLKHLTFRYNSLSGIIPPAIFNLTSLEYISLSDNSLSGSIPMEIGNLERLQHLAMGNNKLSGPIPSKVFNISTLQVIFLRKNSLSGSLPSDMGRALPNLKDVNLFHNKFVGNIPKGLSNASMLTILALGTNEFSGIIPDIFGHLRFLERLRLYENNLTIDDSHGANFFSSLTSCRRLRYLEVSYNPLLTSLPKSIGNLSKSLQYFSADSCGIHGNIPLEVGNMSNLMRLTLSENDFRVPIPATIKGLGNLQALILDSNGLQGPIIDELCEITSLSVLSLSDNKLFGAIPTCLGNMTSLRHVYMDSNRLTSEIPSSFWNLKDILEVNLSSNAFVGTLPPGIGTFRALTLLDLSRNEISGNIPATIGFLQTLEDLSLASNKLQGVIPASLGEMVSLSSLDLSQNLFSGVIPKSLESLTHLTYINLSYNRLQGEIPSGGPFVNFTAQSFMFNEALCGNPRLQVHPCAKQAVRKRTRAKMLLIKFILPIIASIILVATCIIFLQRKRKNAGNLLETNPSNLGAPKRISYYELVQATDGFSESNLLGRGSFGSVYQGMLSSGLMVAIKVFDVHLEATSNSFEVECNAMRNLRHRNLVKIISSCTNVDFKSLVMEFMSNGSLDKWLYSHNYYLDFLQRLSIMIDVASALEYLHHSSSAPVVHCDLKPANILLDEDMVAHVGDFGIAKLLDEGNSKTHTETLATLGYLAPEYGFEGVVSVKGDVYSYGIMLMEVFTRKKPTDDMFATGLSLKNWISQSMHNSIMEVVDSNLVQQHGEQIDDILPHISSILILALSCCADSPKERIKMTDVSASLVKIKTLFT